MHKKFVLLICLVPAITQANIFKGLFNFAFTHNFHTIQKDTAYRSGSMPPNRMARKILRKKIKSVINLRAGEDPRRWQPQQAIVRRRLQSKGRSITFYNIGLSARSLPSRKTILALLEAFKSAPRPVLIHCRSGADRSSLAAALWLITQQHQTKSEALKQLSDSYLHFSRRFPAIKNFISLLPNDPKKVAGWLRTQYRPTLAITSFTSVH